MLWFNTRYTLNSPHKIIYSKIGFTDHEIGGYPKWLWNFGLNSVLIFSLVLIIQKLVYDYLNSTQFNDTNKGLG